MSQAEVFRFFVDNDKKAFSVAQVAKEIDKPKDVTSEACRVLARFGILERLVKRQHFKQPHYEYRLKKE